MTMVATDGPMVPTAARSELSVAGGEHYGREEGWIRDPKGWICDSKGWIRDPKGWIRDPKGWIHDTKGKTCEE
eukprot:9139117-Pyramimonas_sp.AAC.1